MPYQNINELPDSVQKHLPHHAQAIYKEAFNHAWDEYRDEKRRRQPTSREQTAHSVAWSAVKKRYQKDQKTGQWIEKT